MIKNPLLVLKISSRYILICIAFTWIYSLACVLPQLFVLEHGFVLEGFLTSCTFNYLDRSLEQTLLMMAMFVFGFFIPLMLIIVFYFLMWYYLRNNSVFLTYSVRRQTIRSQHEDTSLIASTRNRTLNESKKSNTSQNSSSECQLRREIRVARMIILIVLAFVVAWSPYAVVTLFAQFAPIKYVNVYVTPFTTSLPALFAKLSSVYNPVLYTLTNSACRNFYRQFVVRKIFRLGKPAEAARVTCNTTIKSMVVDDGNKINLECEQHQQLRLLYSVKK